MQVITKKGERYTGGTYYFTLEITGERFNIRALELGLSSIAGAVIKGSYVQQGPDENKLYVCRPQTRKSEELFDSGDENIMKILFLHEKGSKIVDVRAKSSKNKNKTQKDYAELDKLMEAMFGRFERIDAYGPLVTENSTQSESQLCPSRS